MQIENSAPWRCMTVILPAPSVRVGRRESGAVRINTELLTILVLRLGGTRGGRGNDSEVPGIGQRHAEGVVA